LAVCPAGVSRPLPACVISTAPAIAQIFCVNATKELLWAAASASRRLPYDAAGTLRRGTGSVAKYFFHVIEADFCHEDPTGTQLADLKKAHWHAMRLIVEVIDRFPEETDWRRWHVKVADERGRTALIVRFPERPQQPAEYGWFGRASRLMLGDRP
jgi:hypothetical protein